MFSSAAALETAGVGPLREYLQENGDWPLLLGDTWASGGFDWLKTIADLRRVFLSSALLTVYVDQDYQDANTNTIYVSSGNLSLFEFGNSAYPPF